MSNIQSNKQLEEMIEKAIEKGWRSEMDWGFTEFLPDGDCRFHCVIDGIGDTIVLTPLQVFHEAIDFV